MNFGNIDTWRKGHMAVAEWIDAWRILPRAVVVFFGYGVYQAVSWYMDLKPYILEGCIEVGGTVKDCLIMDPTNQHVMLLTGIFGLAAAVFAFYSTSGRKWNGFANWNKAEDEESTTD